MKIFLYIYFKCFGILEVLTALSDIYLFKEMSMPVFKKKEEKHCFLAS